MKEYERTDKKYFSHKQISHKQCKSPCPQTPLTEIGLREPLLSHPDKLQLAETKYDTMETYTKTDKNRKHSAFRVLKILTYETPKSSAKFCNMDTLEPVYSPKLFIGLQNRFHSRAPLDFHLTIYLPWCGWILCYLHLLSTCFQQIKLFTLAHTAA